MMRLKRDVGKENEQVYLRNTPLSICVSHWFSKVYMRPYIAEATDIRQPPTAH
jgi:hypothetical protein